MTHHPHIHMIVPDGGLSPDGQRWISSRPALLLLVRVLDKLFRRLFLTLLTALHETGKLGFYGRLAHLADRRVFLRHLTPVRKKRWVVYANPAGDRNDLADRDRFFDLEKDRAWLTARAERGLSRRSALFGFCYRVGGIRSVKAVFPVALLAHRRGKVWISH